MVAWLLVVTWMQFNGYRMMTQEQWVPGIATEADCTVLARQMIVNRESGAFQCKKYMAAKPQ